MRLGWPPLVATQAAVWAFLTLTGLLVLTNYSAAPGQTATAPRQWPSGMDASRDRQQPTLIMFLHPHCPCSRASLNELARLAARCRDRMQLQVLFVRPSECSPDWHKTNLWALAMAIPGVSVAVDQNGQLAAQFGAKTSGQSLVYDRRGTLVFNGGITGGRGHEGDNPGRSAVVSIAEGHPRRRQIECRAFGCPLSAQNVPRQ